MLSTEPFYLFRILNNKNSSSIKCIDWIRIKTYTLLKTIPLIPILLVFVNYFRVTQSRNMLFWLLKDA